MSKLLLILAAILFAVACFLFGSWLVWLALSVVLPAFGVAAPGYWVVFCGWFLLVSVAGLFRSKS